MTKKHVSIPFSSINNDQETCEYPFLVCTINHDQETCEYPFIVVRNVKNDQETCDHPFTVFRNVNISIIVSI